MDLLVKWIAIGVGFLVHSQYRIYINIYNMNLFIMEFLLFALSILPVILVGTYVYKKDISKEKPKMLVMLFVFGIISCFLTVIISGILGIIFNIFSTDPNTLNWLELTIRIFIGVALVEEFSKWIMVYKISYNDIEFDELYDMIVYAVFVALGFACFENLSYVSNRGFFTGLIRAISAVPSHACDGVFMGYYLGLAKLNSVRKEKKLKIKYLILSLLIPTITHGIYDYCLHTGKLVFIIIFIIFVIVSYIIAIKNINKISKSNLKIRNKIRYCHNCGNIVDGNFCSRCGYKQ